MKRVEPLILSFPMDVARDEEGKLLYDLMVINPGKCEDARSFVVRGNPLATFLLGPDKRQSHGAVC